MVSGARLLGVSVICLLLTGGMGPCGPSTLWGLLMMLLAGACFVASLVVWFVSLVSWVVNTICDRFQQPA